MLLNLDAFSGIYLYREFVDFRKSIDGLLAIVSEQMATEIKGASLFIFVSRRASPEFRWNSGKGTDRLLS